MTLTTAQKMAGMKENPFIRLISLSLYIYIFETKELGCLSHKVGGRATRTTELSLLSWMWEIGTQPKVPVIMLFPTTKEKRDFLFFCYVLEKARKTFHPSASCSRSIREVLISELAVLASSHPKQVVVLRHPLEPEPERLEPQPLWSCDAAGESSSWRTA